jgi:methionyl-tRNA synthetase
LEENGEFLDILNKLSEGEVLIGDNHQINKPEHLFTKISDDVIDAQIAKLEAQEKANKGVSYEALQDTVSFEDFSKMDIRTGTILSAEKVKKTKKLLKLTVDLGFEERTVVSGIAEFFKPENIIGQQVLVLANLAPRKLRGIESQGMILMAKNEEGVLDFVSPGKGMGNGFVVK